MRLGIVTALGVGSAFGFCLATVLLSSGCFFGAFAMKKALASDVVTVECTQPGQKAEFTLPDDSPETFARLSVVLSDTGCDGTSAVLSTKDASAIDGKVTFPCPNSDCQGHAGHPHGTFSFILR